MRLETTNQPASLERREYPCAASGHRWRGVGELDRWSKMKLPNLLLAASICYLTGCDTFFEVHGKVTDYSTGKPVRGARATLVLDKGVEEPDQIAITDETGDIDFLMNEPRGVWATLTVEHTNYCKWSTQFRGTPESKVGVRLVPKAK